MFKQFLHYHLATIMYYLLVCYIQSKDFFLGFHIYCHLDLEISSFFFLSFTPFIRHHWPLFVTLIPVLSIAIIRQSSSYHHHLLSCFFWYRRLTCWFFYSRYGHNLLAGNLFPVAFMILSVCLYKEDEIKFECSCDNKKNE